MTNGRLKRLSTPAFHLSFRAKQAVLPFIILHFLFTPASAQYNTDRLVSIGRAALYYEDYVLSMQYFNQAITAKPYLYEPWFLRAVAKYHLDDFAGAESDCNEAIDRNPFIVNIYELRGLSRIQQQKYADAIDDYTHAISITPDNRGLWHNRVLCHIQNKEYDKALLELDTIQSRWSSYAPALSMRADVHLQQKDTTTAIADLEKSLELDPYDGKTWAIRSMISMHYKEWKQAEQQLDKAIHLLPKNGGYYINRALARYNQNNLRGAMADYDMALEIEPNNFLGHYNRGLLRADVGDDNRAILDFDFVLNLEPENMLAIFNRAVLLERTGDLKAAVRDYTKVIDEYPNFFTGILYRARCYRRMGLTSKAELEEFRVYKSQLYQRLYGTKPKFGRRSQRKRSDLDLEKYAEMVVEDVEEPEREYQSEYRGRVQNRRADTDLLPMFALSLQPHQGEVSHSSHYDAAVDDFNAAHRGRPLYISHRSASLDTEHANDFFAYADSLSAAIARASSVGETITLLLSRAVASTTLQDYASAINDLDAILDTDSTNVMALWQRGVCIARQAKATGTTDNAQKLYSAKSDFDRALRHSQQHAYIYYNRACIRAASGDTDAAIADFTKALDCDPHLPEAYYNRGLCRMQAGQKAEGVTDLSKAGEQGIYQAYSIIKKNRENGKK